MRYESPSLKFRGAVAKAMADVYERRQRDKDVTGTIPCPWCKARVSFTVFPSGKSHGQCSAACGVRWLQ